MPLKFLFVFIIGILNPLTHKIRKIYYQKIRTVIIINHEIYCRDKITISADYKNVFCPPA